MCIRDSIRCPCDLDIWPIHTKIGSCDQDPILNTYSYFEVYIPLSFWYIWLKIADLVVQLLCKRCCHGNNFQPKVIMSAPENAVDRIIRYWVKAYFICIHYVPLWPWPLTYFLQNWGTWPGGRDENICIFGSLYTFSFLKYEIIKCRFSCPVARQPALPLQPFCASLGGGSSSCYAPSMNFIGPSVTELLQFLIWYVTWRCDLDLWPFDLESFHVMPFGWSIPVLSLNWIRLTVPELGQLQLSIDRQLKVPIFTFLGEKGGQISNFIFLTPKRHYLG